ncbi:hypothetical protein SAMN02745126_05962 [Enhydrobacter aerosaccus]|uniref:Uncharacterized protein n=1 Tax=Enhydrobacter aerosaccus TaxID=225324 RepID=A0A1T4TBG2_9HYPH|nr:hypothetical protein [Enhydrobacter aerosaccus]SKA37814.1 hypothetical protein SAMN02745126_05962 [Enhydrobacter aerosaccus]
MNREPDLLPLFGLLVPATFGSLVGLRYRSEQTLQQRLWAFAISVGLGVIGGGVCGEAWHFGPWIVAAVAAFVAIVGQDVVGAIIVVVGGMRTDPLGTVRAWWNLWWNRSSR